MATPKLSTKAWAELAKLAARTQPFERYATDPSLLSQLEDAGMVHAMEGIAALAEVHTRLRAGITAAIQAAHAALDAGDYAEVKRLMSDAEYNQVLINHATDDGDGCPMFYLVSYAGRFQLAQHESRKRNKGVQ